MFSCEFCEICKNTISTEHFWVTVSGVFIAPLYIGLARQEWIAQVILWSYKNDDVSFYANN